MNPNENRRAPRLSDGPLYHARISSAQKRHRSQHASGFGLIPRPSPAYDVGLQRRIESLIFFSIQEAL